MQVLDFFLYTMYTDILYASCFYNYSFTCVKVCCYGDTVFKDYIDSHYTYCSIAM